MGEPMANLDRVLEAIFVLSDPCATAIDMRDDTPPGIAEPDPVTRDGLRYGNGDDERGFVARRERGDVNQGAAAGEKCTLVIERIGGHCHPRKRRAAAWIVDQPCDRQRSRLV